MECLPCLYNCNGKCAPGYFSEASSGRCYLKCPEGWLSNPTSKLCEKITTTKSVIIRSSTIGQNRRFINSKGVQAEAVISGFANEEFGSYAWTISATSADFTNLVTEAQKLLTGIELNKRTIDIPQEKLISGVSYTLEVSFTAGGNPYKKSMLITPLPNVAALSFESQGFPVNLIKLSSSTVASGNVFNFTYALSEVKILQNASWWYILHAEGI